MKPRLGSALMGLAVILATPFALKADDSGPSFAFKLRALLSAPPSDVGLSSNFMSGNLGLGTGFGLEVGMASGKGRVTGELGYSVQPGDEFLANTGSLATSGTNTTVNTTTSIESRKNKLEGLLLRLGYEAPWTSDLSWRAGLQFGGNKFTHQVLGNVYGTSAAGNFADSYHYVGSQSSMAPSPYAGVTWTLDASSSIEVGALFLQYKDLNYQHVANTQNQMDTVPSRSRIEPNLEIAYVFRF